MNLEHIYNENNNTYSIIDLDQGGDIVAFGIRDKRLAMILSESVKMLSALKTVRQFLNGTSVKRLCTDCIIRATYEEPQKKM